MSAAMPKAMGPPEMRATLLALAEHAAFNAFDRLIYEAGVIVGWEKTPEFVAQITLARNLAARETLATIADPIAGHQENA